ncbi:MAG: IS1595 family transposase [Tepidisphaeraceae bacterium]|jgi:transposase-like protein
METKKKFPTQKGQNVLNLTEDQARQHIEKLLWPDGQPVCHSCGSVDCYRMEGVSCRPGLCRCRTCKKQFTVTVGTIFEDSHLPLAVWVRAIHFMSTSKKGMSALQLQRNLGLGSYKTAWHLAHRIRLAMKCQPMPKLLTGEVQIDEAYIGANRRSKNWDGIKRKRGRGTTKTPVLALVETGGSVRSMPMNKVTSATLKAVMQDSIDPSARIVTDEFSAYNRGAREFAGGHFKVIHKRNQYVTADGMTTNTAEAYFALLKRGIHGTFHHVSKQHLHRYCDEFSFRWNGRQLTDTARRDAAVQGAEGKRLTFKAPKAKKDEPKQDGDQLPMF